MTWQHTLKNNFTRLNDLLSFLSLTPEALPLSEHASKSFPLRVSKPYASRMEKGNPNDPLLKQILPVSQELISVAGYTEDPLEESHTNPVPGLLHKYKGRVLLTTTSACGIHCRYCFRRHFPYEANTPGKNAWQRAVDYIAKDTSIHEVILSGGDPLTLPDRSLAHLFTLLKSIPHLRTLRIHTRMPMVIPSRVTPELLALLTDTPWQIVMVLHINHANEIDDEVKKALSLCQDHRINLLNQSVLLAGVNDHVDTLEALSHGLWETGVLPYYLHMPDKVAGTAHFDVSKEKATSLLQELLMRLPGYLVPRLVVEIPKEGSKVPLNF